VVHWGCRRAACLGEAADVAEGCVDSASKPVSEGVRERRTLQLSVALRGGCRRLGEATYRGTVRDAYFETMRQ